jgi:MYXO-CTERM domain-containing protein
MRMLTMGCGVVALGAMLLGTAVNASDIYGLNMRGGYQMFRTTTDDFVGGFTMFGDPWAAAAFAMDLDPTATTMYAIMYDQVNTYGTVDLDTGLFSPLGQLSGPTAVNTTGLSVDPTTGIWYLTNADGLYAGDITTGVFNFVGSMGFSLCIDLAIDSQGNAYGMDIATDELFSINLSTGLGTVIGPTGMAANYAQGMDFDYATDTLYATIYTGGGTGAFCWYDLNTGAAHIIQDTTPLNAEMEMVVATGIPAPGALALLGLAGLARRRRR